MNETSENGKGWNKDAYWEKYWEDIEAVTGPLQDITPLDKGKKRVYKGTAAGSVSIDSERLLKEKRAALKWLESIENSFSNTDLERFLGMMYTVFQYRHPRE